MERSKAKSKPNGLSSAARQTLPEIFQRGRSSLKRERSSTAVVVTFKAPPTLNASALAPGLNGFRPATLLYRNRDVVAGRLAVGAVRDTQSINGPDDRDLDPICGKGLAIGASDSGPSL